MRISENFWIPRRLCSQSCKCTPGLARQPASPSPSSRLGQQEHLTACDLQKSGCTAGLLQELAAPALQRLSGHACCPAGTSGKGHLRPGSRGRAGCCCQLLPHRRSEADQGKPALTISVPLICPGAARACIPWSFRRSSPSHVAIGLQSQSHTFRQAAMSKGLAA